MENLFQNRIDHERAVVGSQCVARRLEEPQHPEGQVIVPKNLFIEWKGPEFFTELEKRGHDHATWVDCKCRRK